MLFERFVSRERNEPPDIDVDFEHQRREEVIQYIYTKYGRDRAALAATVITYRAKSALRDVGRALGFENAMIDRLARSMSWWDGRKVIPERAREAGLDPQADNCKLLFLLINLITGFPRHLSQHVGGFVIAADELSNLVPVENATIRLFMNRRATPTGNEMTSYGSRSTACLASPSFHSHRQRPVMAMKVSLVSWLCMSGPLPGLARQ